MHKAIFVFGLLFNLIVLSWILKLERTCSCSDDWRRDYIKYYSMFSIAMGLLLAMSKFSKLPILLFVPAYLTYLFSVLTYVPTLHRHECDCATKGDWRDDFIFWWILGAVVLGAFGSLIVSGRR